MRLHPAITEEEAYAWLKKQLADEGSANEGDGDVEAELNSFAEAMAAISGVVLNDELEPLFP